MDAVEITKYKDMALRRKYWIVIPFLLAVLGGLTYFLIAPKIYQAQTLILVQPQEVPRDYVRSLVSTSIEDRLRTISQQVTSRTNLERIIKEFYLIENTSSNQDMSRMVWSLRSQIRIDVRSGQRSRQTSTFTIAFQGKVPETVMKVANALASNFISENLKIRESQAQGTSTFLANELESVKRRLLIKENELKEYKVSILKGLQSQLDQLSSNLRDAENRKIAVQKQTRQQSRTTPRIAVPLVLQQQEPRDLQSLKNQLAYLEAKYTEKHPDVIRLREMIDTLERGQDGAEKKNNSSEPTTSRSGIDQALNRQIEKIDIEIQVFKDEIKKNHAQIKWYKKRIEETPQREQELLSLKRDYENLKGLYNSLLNRKLESEIAVSMEKQQKGEQFKVIDHANIPTRPIKPDVRRIFMFTLLLGLGLGLGLAYLKEILDTSFKTPEEIEKELQMPVLASVPFIYTEKDRKKQKIKGIMTAASVTVGFIFSAVGIIFAIKGIDTTVNYVKTALTNLGVL
jgi:polysaccharide chain length determinant protein (PEP-CTERM system associated)